MAAQMPKFLTPLRVEWMEVTEMASLKLSLRRAHARLLEPLLLSVDEHTVEIPAGFVTDFASVPKIFWNIFPATDPYYTRPAVVHDWGYRFGGKYPLAGFGGCLNFASRGEVDRLFLDLMDAEGTSWVSRRLIHRAVRLFGGLAWRGPKQKGVAR